MRKNRSYKLLSQVFSSADVSIYALLFPDEMVAQATNFQVSSRNKGNKINHYSFLPPYLAHWN